jgi:hypothetical protein
VLHRRKRRCLRPERELVAAVVITATPNPRTAEVVHLATALAHQRTRALDMPAAR